MLFRAYTLLLINISTMSVYANTEQHQGPNMSDFVRNLDINRECFLLSLFFLKCFLFFLIMLLPERYHLNYQAGFGLWVLNQ